MPTSAPLDRELLLFKGWSGVRNRRSAPWVESEKGCFHAKNQVGHRVALKAVDTRQACAAYEYLMAAIVTANKLPKPVLLALGGHVRGHAKGRKGGQWDLMRAYATFLEGPLETARMRKLQELYGLREVPPLAPFIEDEADESDDGGAADEVAERCPGAIRGAI